MIFLDCGNRCLKAQSRDAGKLTSSYVCSYQTNWIQPLNLWMRDVPAAHCYLASVLDSDRQQQLEQFLAQGFGDSVTRFTTEPEAFGVTNAYRQPERLGVDRWLSLLAAAQMVSGNVIIIDAGSAITLDLLRADGQHLGGAILPGLNTPVDEFKRIFKNIDFNDPKIKQTSQPGCSTEAAIHIDYARSSSEILPGLVDRWINCFEDDAILLLAGGDAARVQREIDRPGRIVPDLVFRGMRRLASQ